MRTFLKGTLMLVAIFTVFSTHAGAQSQERVFRVDATPITNAFLAFRDADQAAELARLTGAISEVLKILKEPVPEGATPEERARSLEIKGQAATAILLTIPSNTVVELEMYQLVDQYVSGRNQITIGLSITTPVSVNFGFLTEQQTRQRAANYFRINATYARGTVAVVSELVDLIRRNQDNSVAVLQKLFDVITQQQAERPTVGFLVPDPIRRHVATDHATVDVSAVLLRSCYHRRSEIAQ
jgi:hypothetical protein